ncbi:hypothetical protein DLJ61_24225 [Gordonia terrae]|uniref:Uncharacterized protein n=1 Tax=Gordonia terrae TaxID=2055 RepID=A0AAD0KAC8_9ACTN|nr:hypothetical protein DLJ61_24225 [Gordonia terrae]
MRVRRPRNGVGGRRPAALTPCSPSRRPPPTEVRGAQAVTPLLSEVRGAQATAPLLPEVRGAQATSHEGSERPGG